MLFLFFFFNFILHVLQGRRTHFQCYVLSICFTNILFLNNKEHKRCFTWYCWCIFWHKIENWIDTQRHLQMASVPTRGYWWQNSGFWRQANDENFPPSLTPFVCLQLPQRKSNTCNFKISSPTSPAQVSSPKSFNRRYKAGV